jgi:hypothetical protein
MKQQVLILKVKYEESENHAPNTWDWTSLVGNEHVVEVMNHGKAEEVEEG